eukprot:TRINITY_DN57156_c0_g1_i1.p1 TRINITY_DN57156_c0_g1~~TRINITY_DN57156_c0_g1_i1.p1  ORF type:complete len:205 (-),score=83.60 TRINITY_DN57156_c0_g1_i1:33-647(-)
MPSAAGSPQHPAAPDGSPKKKISHTEEESLVKKLHYQSLEKRNMFEQKRQQQLEMENKIPGLKAITQQQEAALVEHLYTQQLQNALKKKEKRDQELQKANELPAKKMSESETLESIDRMYYQEKQRRQAAAEKLLHKYQPPMPTRILPADKMQEVNKRLSPGKDHFPELRKQLWEKHYGKEPQSKKLSREQLMAVTDRLTTKAA